MSVLRSQGSIMKSGSFPAAPMEDPEPDQPVQCPDGGYCMPESTCCQNKARYTLRPIYTPISNINAW